jgi:hypothetical protein
VHRLGMSNESIIIAFGSIVLVALIAGIWYMFRVWNSPDGERYMRERSQGPFVPLNEENVATERGPPEERSKS